VPGRGGGERRPRADPGHGAPPPPLPLWLPLWLLLWLPLECVTLRSMRISETPALLQCLLAGEHDGGAQGPGPSLSHPPAHGGGAGRQGVEGRTGPARL
jgi:hypothetical protein